MCSSGSAPAPDTAGDHDEVRAEVAELQQISCTGVVWIEDNRHDLSAVLRRR
jgi:predicted alpha/beta-hydrolase family hydrolase